MKRNALFSMTGFLIGALASNAFAQAFDLSWYTIDGGGVMSATGGTFELSGTIGQPDAGSPSMPMTGGTFELVGGFWSVTLSETPCPGARGDANCDSAVDFFDIDPFLDALFDPAGYLAANCDGSFCAVDIDCSGAVDFFDIDPFLACIFGACPPCAP